MEELNSLPSSHHFLILPSYQGLQIKPPSHGLSRWIWIGVLENQWLEEALEEFLLTNG
jgi:hypothetical protein